MTENKIRDLITYWAGRFNLPLPYLYRDNRIRNVGYVNACAKHNFYQFVYNFKRLSRLPKAEILQIIFHELGHIKYGYLPKGTEKDLIKNEYMAEKFSVKHLKLYYPDYYKKEVKIWREVLKKGSWGKKYPIHYKAFSKIKEYKT